MLRIEEISLDYNDDKKRLPSLAAGILGTTENKLVSWKIQKRAIDSRRKNAIRIIYSLDVEAENEDELLARLAKAGGKKSGKTCGKTSGKTGAVSPLARHRIRKVEPFVYSAPVLKTGFSGGRKKARPLVVGCGPCGLFAALVLARAGLEPLVVERGRQVGQRVKDVEDFLRTGNLNPSSNIQFGEGGAGTFSDGKLYTLVNDSRSGFIYSEFIKAGAPPEIAYDAKPHIGTDRLRDVVKNLKNAVEKAGGEFLFETCLEDIKITGGRIESAIFSTGE